MKRGKVSDERGRVIRGRKRKKGGGEKERYSK